MYRLVQCKYHVKEKQNKMREAWNTGSQNEHKLSA